MKLSVIGTGYVGLVSGVCLAHLGHDVVCVDIDAAKVDLINDGECPIHEDGLRDLLLATLGTRFRATTDLAEAVASTEMTLIAVGTPFGEAGIDLRQIEAAAFSIGEELAKKDIYHVVTVKSTVVPGTTEDVVLPILEEASGKKAGPDFGVGMNPESLREGVAVADFLNPDRIILGGIDDAALGVMSRLYEVFTDVDVIHTTPRTAEMIKYTANSLLATLISFANEIGNLSTALGVDSTEVFQGVHLDHRLSPIIDGKRITPSIVSYLEAGCGYGGSCLPKDVKALVAHAKVSGVPSPMLSAALEVNETQHHHMINPVVAEIPTGSRVAVLGASFKPNTDDIRESPTLRIVPALIEAGYEVVLHDPIALEYVAAELGDSPSYEADLATALDGADAVLLVTSWADYASVPQLLDDAGASPLVVDGRRMLDPNSVTRYTGIGFPGSR